MKRIKAGLLALALVLSPVSGFAAIITYDFTINGGTTGALAGVTSNGYFSYDDVYATPNGSFGGVGMFTDFSLSWAGRTYDRTIAEPSWLGFNSSRTLSLLVMGDNCVYSTCYGSGSTVGFTAVHYLTNSGPGSFSYTLANGQYYNGTITTTLRNVPEPEMASLMLAGMGGLGVLAWRRRRLGRAA